MGSKDTLRIISDTHFILSLNDGIYAASQLEGVKENVQTWIKEGGLLILPISCEIEDLRETSKAIVADITSGNGWRHPYNLGVWDTPPVTD